jgi:hypothetical protein
VPVLFVLLLVPIAILFLIPLSLVQRYRTATTRRMARGWVATLNVAALLLSIALYLAGALLTSVWAPGAFTYALGGLLVGSCLGIAGLVLSRWETTSGSMHYTPNRWLVLGITLIVSARLLYGFWRGWHAWRFTPQDGSWLAEAGAAGSLGAGAIVLGYYLTYWLGVRRRVRRHRLVSIRRLANRS